MDRKIFLKALKKSENSEISKEDILRVAAEYGIDLPKRMARDKVIDIIAVERYEALESAFTEFLYVPSWEVADHYGLTSEKVDKLNDLGVIKEIAKYKEFYSRSSKQHFTARTYPLSSLEYDEEKLKIAYDEAFGHNGYRLRVETKNEDEINLLLSEFDKIFEVIKTPDTYEQRNGEGFYHYFTISPISCSDFKKDALRLEIDKLKFKIEENKLEFDRRLKNVVKDESEHRKRLIQENEDLRGKLNALKNDSTNNAGRKARFSIEEQNAIYMRHLGGDAMRSIALDYNCSVGLVHKIINERKRD